MLERRKKEDKIIHTPEELFQSTEDEFGTVTRPKNLFVDERIPKDITKKEKEAIEKFRVERSKDIEEKDPSGADPHQNGAKLDAGKIPVFQGLIDYFPNACIAVAEVSHHGAKKYTWKGWINVPNGKVRYTDAMVRHLIKESIGEEIDPDFGLLHAAHLAWGALARLELILLEKQHNKYSCSEPTIPQPQPSRTQHGI